MYLLGGVVVDLSRTGLQMVGAPLRALAVGLIAVAIVIVYPTRIDLANALRSPWVLLLIAGVVFKPQLMTLLSRLRKAELPGGLKLEVDAIDKIEEHKRTLNSWQRSLNDFGQLIERVSNLIETTQPEDRVRFLAYTPALGFLTRPHGEWERLHRLLLERTNIQIICLQRKELARWHWKFKNKPTRRPGGIIDTELIKRAQSTSEAIIAEKRRYHDVNEPVPTVKRLSWRELPGYYLFANSKSAIIATPFFLPDDPRKCTNNRRINRDNMETTPVEMLGFESTDSWTVWMVNNLCDRYVQQPVELLEMMDVKTTFQIRGEPIVPGAYEARFDERSGMLTLSQGKRVVARVGAFLRQVERRTGHLKLNLRGKEPKAELVSINFSGSNYEVNIQPPVYLRAIVNFERDVKLGGKKIASGPHSVFFDGRTRKLTISTDTKRKLKVSAYTERANQHAAESDIGLRGKGADAELVSITLKDSNERIVIGRGAVLKVPSDFPSGGFRLEPVIEPSPGMSPNATNLHPVTAPPVTDASKVEDETAAHSSLDAAAGSGQGEGIN